MTLIKPANQDAIYHCAAPLDICSLKIIPIEQNRKSWKRDCSNMLVEHDVLIDVVPQWATIKESHYCSLAVCYLLHSLYYIVQPEQEHSVIFFSFIHVAPHLYDFPVQKESKIFQFDFGLLLEKTEFFKYLLSFLSLKKGKSGMERHEQNT